MARQLRLTVNRQHDYAKLVWAPPNQPDSLPYTIDPSELDEPVARLRTCLEAVGGASPDRIDDAVRALADAGKVLRDKLFVAGDPADDDIARDMLEWFEEDVARLAEPHDLTILSDPVLHLPWGLLHDTGGAGDDPYGGFWALKYRVAAPHYGMRPRGIAAPRDGRDLQLLFGVDTGTFSEVKKNLDLRDVTIIDSLMGRKVGAAINVDGCRKLWAEVGTRDCVLHFFGHGTGGGIRLTKGDILTPRMFRQHFRRDRRRGDDTPKYVLSVFNGCRTAAGEMRESFLTATADLGFCGFVGLEADVPAEFAVLFGQALTVSLLNNNWTLRDTMHDLWRRHRPLALFYGCYAHPDFRIGPGAAIDVPEGLLARNLSDAWRSPGAA